MPQPIPRDVHGQPLAIGDTVSMRFIIVGCTKHDAGDGNKRELMTLQAVGVGGKSGLTPRLDAIEPGLVELVEMVTAAHPVMVPK